MDLLRLPFASWPGYLRRLSYAWRMRQTHKSLLKEDLTIFEEDYGRIQDPEYSKPPEVGRPFLLRPRVFKAGVVLVHGFTAAPMEMRPIAEFLCRRGYAVYAVRVKGHGTTPQDLAQTPWTEWYESVERGCAIMRALTKDVILGGFSAGGSLALLTAGRGTLGLRGVFSICAPLYLRYHGQKIATAVVAMNSLLKRINWADMQWEYTDSTPSNLHINYAKVPIAGIAQLDEAIKAMIEVLPNIDVPTLIIQASGDMLVRPESGPALFDMVGARERELLVLQRDRHGIVTGPGSEDVFFRVAAFLEWICGRDTDTGTTIPALLPVEVPKTPDEPEAVPSQDSA
jgi:esterase/lipase